MPKPVSADPVRRIATINMDRNKGATRDERIAHGMKLLDEIAAIKPDIVCLPEVWSAMEHEEVPGPTTQAVSAWAKKNDANVICPLLTWEDGVEYNSAVVINRRGEIVGIYHKAHLTEGGLETGRRPGPLDAPVFELDGVKVGIQICFDVNWRQTWRHLKDKGAQVIFFAAAFPAARRVAALAWMLEVPIVSSMLDRSSRIYDITGDVVAETGLFQQWTWADINLGKRLFEIDFHLRKARQIRAKYGDKVEIKWFHDEDWWTLASWSKGVSVAQLIKDYGLLPFYGYLPRAKQANEGVRPKPAKPAAKRLTRKKATVAK